MQTAQQMPNLAAGFKNNIGCPVPQGSIGNVMNQSGQPNLQQVQIPQNIGMQMMQPQLHHPQMNNYPNMVNQCAGTDANTISIFGQMFQKKYFYLFIVFILLIIGYFVWKWYSGKKKDNDDDEDEENEDFGYDQQMMPPMGPGSMNPQMGMGQGNHPMMNQMMHQQMMARRMGSNVKQPMKENPENNEDNNDE